MDEYFGEQFDIHQNKPIHCDGHRLPKFDIVLSRKDRSHRTRAIADYIDANDVVAVFEVKSTMWYLMLKRLRKYSMIAAWH